ncbi:MAG: ATP-binding response regulator [Anaerolineae bacterium]
MSALTKDSGWREVQYGTGWKTTVILALAAWCSWLYQAASFPWDGWLLAVSVLGVLLLLLPTVTRWLSPFWLAVEQVFLAFTGVTVAYVALGYEGAAFFYPVPVLLAALLLTPGTGIGTAFAAVLVILIHPPASRQVLFSYCLGLLTTGALIAAHARDLHRELAQSFRYCQRTAALAHELGSHQEEVNRLNKSLRLANGLLKRSLQELALAQREAEEARHLKAQFATTVSHELRTPLNIILGFVEVMQKYPGAYGDVNWTPLLRRDLNEIQRSAAHLSALVDDILDLARAQALKMPIHREHTDLRLLIEEAVDLASRLVHNKADVRLQLELPDSLPTLYVDRTRIRQVLLNLLANACRLTEAGEIVVRAVTEKDEVVISVRDTGPGIAATHLETIFDEFQQGHWQEMGEPRQGKGLGLAICKRFVHLHGGRIWAASELGRGSTFSLALPLLAKQVATLAPPSLQKVPAEPMLPKLVLVGDEEARALLSRRLDGYEIVTAPDLSQARKLVRKLHPRALIVNVPSDVDSNSHGSPPAILPEPLPVLQCSLPVGRWFRETDLFDDWLVKPVDSDRLLQVLGHFPKPSHILVVDDDRPFVRLLGRILAVAMPECRLDCAYSGTEALAKLAQQDADMVLLDIALPGPSGRTVAQALRQQRQAGRTAVIAVTALQPGLEGTAATACTFAVTASAGFSEETTVDLIRMCLAHLQPTYGEQWPESALPVMLAS